MGRRNPASCRGAGGRTATGLAHTMGSPGSHRSQLQPAAPQAISWLCSPKYPKSRLLHMLCCFGSAEEPAPSSQSTQLSSSTRGLSRAPRGVISLVELGAGVFLGAVSPKVSLDSADLGIWRRGIPRGGETCVGLGWRQQAGEPHVLPGCGASVSVVLGDGGTAHRCWVCSPQPGCREQGAGSWSPAPGLGAQSPPGDHSPWPGVSSTGCGTQHSSLGRTQQLPAQWVLTRNKTRLQSTQHLGYNEHGNQEERL